MKPSDIFAIEKPLVFLMSQIKKQVLMLMHIESENYLLQQI